MGPRAAVVLSCRIGAVISLLAAQMGPRAAVVLSCRIGAVIDPRCAVVHKIPQHVLLAG
jgi:hypothetical protein